MRWGRKGVGSLLCIQGRMYCAFLGAAVNQLLSWGRGEAERLGIQKYTIEGSAAFCCQLHKEKSRANYSQATDLNVLFSCVLSDGFLVLWKKKIYPKWILIVNVFLVIQHCVVSTIYTCIRICDITMVRFLWGESIRWGTIIFESILAVQRWKANQWEHSGPFAQFLNCLHSSMVLDKLLNPSKVSQF